MKRRASTLLQVMRTGRHETAGGRVRFSEAARQAAIGLVDRRRAEGIALKVVAREIGVGYETLRRWLSDRQAFRPVSVTAATVAEPRGIVVVLPGGVGVEGLDLESVAELARQLR